MNHRITAIILLAVLMGACGREHDTVTRPDSALIWYGSLEEALTAAGETGDMILISFEAPWCPWSRLMRESVYVNQAVVESLATVKCVVSEAGRDTTLQRELGIVVYPTVVLTDAYGREKGRMIGYHSPEEFLGRLSTVKHSRDNLSDMFRREETLSEDPEFLMAFGRLLLEMGMYEGALLRFDRATRIDQDSAFADIEEAEYSMAECYMLSGEYREAGRRFRIFAERFHDSERREIAQVLAGMCYQKAGYFKVSTGIYEDYLETFAEGEFAPFVRAVLDSMKRQSDNAG
jgi:tetratricopeptide (TPR) repeat protein